MEIERLDCSWCGSARSIEYGICQVCLMEYSVETKVIKLPDRTEPAHTVDLTGTEVGVAE